METVDMALTLVAGFIFVVFLASYANYKRWSLDAKYTVLRHDFYNNEAGSHYAHILVGVNEREEYAKSHPGFIKFIYTFDEKMFHTLYVGCNKPLPNNCIIHFFISRLVEKTIESVFFIENNERANMMDVRLYTDYQSTWHTDQSVDHQMVVKMVTAVYG